MLLNTLPMEISFLTVNTNLMFLDTPGFKSPKLIVNTLPFHCPAVSTPSTNIWISEASPTNTPMNFVKSSTTDALYKMELPVFSTTMS